ncbi:MAG TPA: AtpZ/AtpI family protein [Armatimonadota bacterium]|nr:AtpZ/AtpI family protein [Armatimonadota bacterium]
MTNRDYNWMRKAGLASSIGIMMVVSVVIGWLFGSWLDSKLGTAPWMMLIFTLMGIAAGFIEMIRIAIVLSKED